MSWEVFDARTGTVVHVVRWEWLAKLLCRWSGWHDYARPGEGWSL